ncbi:protein disabled isoform X2 [Cimex lectularius]|uniref:PID domain-containing protein n=1 Tax=Cimex lectularius TaxID=79782 RepID=A0A8I6SJW4_CIMLE|nr:protein disabled isoform X2 [Cimex lectularius]
MQTLRKKTSPCKYKNEPARFLGDGVSFKAKLIGILEVSEARGDRMCQEALADLKMAIRAAGEHKQRININIAIDGLRLRDEKTGDCLYHHPVHKISFIAQDMSDSRAFGYIFGSPDTGHRFFGIKTDKAASQVVITMRDLFQVVFELKKKEIEMAKQHIEQHQKFTTTLFSDSTNKTSIEPLKIRPINQSEERSKDNASAVERSDNPEHIMDLLDLELELSNIQQGINQMDRITPSDPFGPAATNKVSTDPFGDSFNPLSNKAKLPPPPDTGKKTKSNEKHWFDQETEALFEETELPTSLASIQSNAPTSFPLTTISGSPLPSEAAADDAMLKKLDLSPSRDQFDVFTDLDPLGTGRSKPYIDKKDFFQDLKNPPKKVLKDLVTEVPVENKKTLFHGNFECDTPSAQQSSKSEEGNVSKTSAPAQLFSDPFQDDPFDKDPFSEVDFSKSIFTPSSSSDPFEKFADFASFPNQIENIYATVETVKQSTFSGELSKSTPLKVSLPPEKLGSNEYASVSPIQSRKARGYQKTNTIGCVISKPPSPKQKTRYKMLSQTSDVYGERNSPIMEGVTIKSRNTYFTTPEKQYNDSSAPEPPPRSALNCLSMKPPPLPPKRIPCAISSRPPPRPPHSDYDYIENYQTTHFTNINSPPLPAPARKPKIIGKPSTDTEYYLQPFPLLPPPKKKSAAKNVSATSEIYASTKLISSSTAAAVTSPPTFTTTTVTSTETVPSSSAASANKSLDITLSQLTKTGFSDLAATLNMSPTSLSKMTLQELTKCLAKLSNNDNQNKDLNSQAVLNSECYSVDEGAPFKAEFEAHFTSNEFPKKEEESLFDKYAVFRELLEEEKKQCEEVNEETQVGDKVETNQFDEVDERKTGEPTKVENVEPPSEDRYAALRDICLDETIEKCDDKYEDLSDKDDSIIEPSRLEEDTDLLPQSRPHSESTESPTVTTKEHQSIMEATIMEEDISALEVDEEDVPEESIDETLKEQLEPDSVVDNSVNRATINKVNDNIQYSHPEGVAEAKGSTEINSSWAKFDSNNMPLESASSIHSEGHISPWSTESKDNDLSPACRDKRKHRKVRRHKQNQWQEDEESEEGWDGRVEHSSWSPSWRENGWSDGDSLYNETHGYIEHDYPSPRRGRRRRMSPWNSREQSPWEEDDRDLSEDQWEGSRWQDDVCQRPKHRGQSWEDERRRHYEEPRKPRNVKMWSNEPHAWEDDERYQKRNYIDRRRRKWDEDVHNRNRNWRERDWAEAGMKMSNRYCKERSHDSHWDSEYGEHDDESSHWNQRPRSCDRGRRQFSGHHSSDSDFPDRRYMRSREGHCSDLDYRRKAQTLQRQKQRRKHSQNSPFEDDFSSQFSFSKESPGGPDAFDPEIKTSPVPFETHKKPGFTDSSRVKDFSQYPSHSNIHSQPEYRDSSGNKISRSYQQSPFEDDFTSPDNRRCSGRSASSDLSDPRGSDEIFPGHPELPKPSRSDVAKRPKSANQAESLTRNTKSFKSVPPQLDSHKVPHQTKTVTHPECEMSDVNIAQCMTDKKGNNSDCKGRISNLKRSDSSSSLRKSESVNIFARNNDPFDDDFFCEENTTLHRNKDKLSKTLGHESKWADSFNAFSFDEETK